jgi:tetratricopeptide (TPR) repeat protein
MSETPRLDELKRRVQRDPASISFAALAEEYRRLGMFPDAIETCRAGLLRHPSYISAKVTLGRALVEIGEYNDAAAELEHVLQSAPENLAAIRALADIHRRRGEVSDVDHYSTSFRTLDEEAKTDDAKTVDAKTVDAKTDVMPAPPEPVRIAVKSASVPISPVVELEAFLAAIERVRRDVTVQAVR